MVENESNTTNRNVVNLILIKSQFQLLVTIFVTSFPVTLSPAQFRLLTEISTETEKLCDDLDLQEPLPYTCDASSRYRTADGSCNNLLNPPWGKSSYPVRRVFGANYIDGESFQQTFNTVLL